MAILRYESTLVPSSAWSRLTPRRREQLTWLLWAVTWVGLAAGYYDRRYWQWVVGFSVAHALFVLGMVRWRPLVFVAQLRIVYAAWVALGTYVPQLTWMMHITTIGLLSNLAVGWCPLARMLYLLPWNREEPFELSLLWRVFLSKPVPGRFRPPPAKSSLAAGSKNVRAT